MLSKEIMLTQTRPSNSILNRCNQLLEVDTLIIHLQTGINGFSGGRLPIHLSILFLF